MQTRSMLDYDAEYLLTHGPGAIFIPFNRLFPPEGAPVRYRLKFDPD
jgi:hypothetical protein